MVLACLPVYVYRHNSCKVRYLPYLWVLSVLQGRGSSWLVCLKYAQGNAKSKRNGINSVWIKRVAGLIITVNDLLIRQQNTWNCLNTFRLHKRKQMPDQVRHDAFAVFCHTGLDPVSALCSRATGLPKCFSCFVAGLVVWCVANRGMNIRPVFRRSGALLRRYTVQWIPRLRFATRRMTCVKGMAFATTP